MSLDVHPPAFAAMLGDALAVEDAEGSPRAAILRRHYLDLMPAMRAAQLDPSRQPQATFLHAPLDLDRLPRMRAALTALFALLERCGVAPEPALPGASFADLVARHSTLAALYAATYYGDFMPFLYAYPADLDAFARELAAGDTLDGVLDRRFTTPLIHELSHFGRARTTLLPLYLDECIAAHVGVHVWPELAYPRPGEDNGIYATPWLAQVGQALAAVVGLAPLVRAHAGAASWDDVLPAGLRAAARERGVRDYLAHRGPHLLSDNFRPEPWLELIYQHGGEPAESEADHATLVDALRAMCLDNELVGATYRTRSRLPRGPVRIDVAARRVTAPGGPHDPRGLAYALPPALCRRWQESGITDHSIEIGELGAIPDIAHVLRG